MGTLDDIRAQLGENFDRKAELPAAHNWVEVCSCGHLSKYHAQAIGGLYSPREPEPTRFRGEDWTRTFVARGCNGALKPQGFVEETASSDHASRTLVVVSNPTCPCDDFQPIAKVDRPNRYFNQRIPLHVEAQKEFIRHPFVTGIRAFSTHLSRRKAADPDRGGKPEWADREFDRRFTWLPRQCAISSCFATDDVWPTFVNPAEGDLRSQLRCPKHR